MFRDTIPYKTGEMPSAMLHLGMERGYEMGRIVVLMPFLNC
jgi:hypothetical protein